MVSSGCCCCTVVTGIVDVEIESLEDSLADRVCADRLTIVGGGAAVKTGNIM